VEVGLLADALVGALVEFVFRDDDGPVIIATIINDEVGGAFDNDRCSLLPVSAANGGGAHR
jgi:hypothetical protein